MRKLRAEKSRRTAGLDWCAGPQGPAPTPICEHFGAIGRGLLWLCVPGKLPHLAGPFRHGLNKDRTEAPTCLQGSGESKSGSKQGSDLEAPWKGRDTTAPQPLTLPGQCPPLRAVSAHLCGRQDGLCLLRWCISGPEEIGLDLFPDHCLGSGHQREGNTAPPHHAVVGEQPNPDRAGEAKAKHGVP